MNAGALTEPWNVRARVRRWLAARLPRTDSQLLTQGNIYIVPTRAGWMFALTLIVLLLASINYQLNLGYVLTFLLAGSGIVSMHITHGTLRGLTLHLRPVGPAFGTLRWRRIANVSRSLSIPQRRMPRDVPVSVGYR